MALNKGLRRGVAILAALSLASVGLAGCSSSDGSDAKDGKKEEKTAAKDGDAVTIKYLHRLPDAEGMVTVKEIVERWNKDHPDIKVEAEKFQGEAGDMIKKLETDVKANNAPCLAQLAYSEVPEMFTKDMLEDVTEEAKKYEDKFGGAFDQMNIGGKIVGLPQDSGPLVYMYNKTAFEELGLDVPKTSDEFVETAKKAAEKGKFIADFEPDEVQNWLSGQAVAAGEPWYDATGDAWKVDAENEGSQKVAKFWQDLLDAKAVLTETRWDDGFKKAVTDGKLIGTIAAAWEPALFVGDFGETDQSGHWQVTQLPDFGKGKTGPDGGSGVAVMKGCEHPAEAMEFNAWFNTQIDDLATQGLVVAAKGDVATPEDQKEFFGGQDFMKELVTANENMVALPYIPGFSTVRDPMVKAAEAAATGSGKVSDIFKAAQDASVKALEDNNLPVAK